MATEEALEALQQTQKALTEIGTHLRPFVQRLRDVARTDTTAASSTTTTHSTTSSRKYTLAQAQAAVALSLGTLRYMGARLRGLDQGRKADDPLRQELNQMRKVLVDIEKLGKEEKKASNASTPSKLSGSLSADAENKGEKKVKTKQESRKRKASGGPSKEKKQKK